MSKRKIKNNMEIREIPERIVGLDTNNKCPYCGWLVKKTNFSIEPIGFWIVTHWNKKQDCYNKRFYEHSTKSE